MSEKLYKELKKEADENYKGKNYTNAIKKYTKALLFVKSNSDEYIICHNNIAQCYIELNDFANAIEHAFLVIKKEKTNEKALARIRVCYKKLGYDKLGPQCNDTYKDTTSSNGHCSIARELMNLNPHQDFFAKSEGKSGGDNAQIVHTYHKIPGDGNCFFSSVYTCLENAKLLDNLNSCFESYDEPIVLDTTLKKELQYIKALREMCIKSEEYKQDLEGVYEGFFVHDAVVMTEYILNGVSHEQLNALGFETKYKSLSRDILNTLTPKLVAMWGLEWQPNLLYGSLVLIDLLSENKEIIATIYYSEPPNNFVNRTFGSLDLKSTERIFEKRNDPKRKERYITEIQNLNNINVLLKNKPWATQVEVSFLTRKLKECGKISIDVKHDKISEPQPIIDSDGNQIIYVLNKNQTHYDAYLRTKPTALLSNTSGGGGGAETPSEWSCAACTFINKPGSKVCEMCDTQKPTSNNSKINKSIGGKERSELDSIEEKDGNLYIKFKFGPNTGFEKSENFFKREFFSKTIGEYIITIRIGDFLYIEVAELIPRVQSISIRRGNSSFGASDTAQIRFTSDFKSDFIYNEQTYNFEIIIKKSPLFIESVSIENKKYTSPTNRYSGLQQEFKKIRGGSRRKRKSARKHKSKQRKTRARRTKSRSHSS